MRTRPKNAYKPDICMLHGIQYSKATVGGIYIDLYSFTSGICYALLVSGDEYLLLHIPILIDSRDIPTMP